MTLEERIEKLEAEVLKKNKRREHYTENIAYFAVQAARLKAHGYYLDDQGRKNLVGIGDETQLIKYYMDRAFLEAQHWLAENNTDI